MKIIAIDPGKVSGIAELIAFPPSLDVTRQFWSDEASTWEAVEYVHDQLSGAAVPPTDLLVVEAFVISARTLRGTRQYDALESIGALRYLAGRAHAVTFQLVKAGDSKRLATDDKLRMLGWYDPSPGGHKNDAARLLLGAALRNGLIDAGEFL